MDNRSRSSAISQLVSRGLTTREIAQKLALSTSTVDRVLRELRDAGALERRAAQRFRAAHVAESVIRLRDRGLSQSAIALQLGIARARVRAILRAQGAANP